VEYLQQAEIPCPEPIAFQKWNAVQDASNRRETCDNFGKHPLAIGTNMRFLRGVEVGTVETSNSECKNELEEAQDGTADRANRAARGGIVCETVHDCDS